VQELSGTVQIDLPSPRVVGYYEDANALGDPYVSMAYATLIYPVARLVSGDNARWETDHGGDVFLRAIATWQQARLRDHIFLLDVFYEPVSLPPSAGVLPNGRLGSLRNRYVNPLRGQDLPPLVALWNWPTDAHFGALDQTATQEAEAFVIYIEERYGKDGVVRFLHALGKAHSLETAIETALPVSFGDFYRQWTKWIAGE
jgi:hypothetical protein